MSMKYYIDVVNKASRTIANVFGMQSLQYRQLKSVIFSNIPDVLISTAKKGYFRLSKSKQSIFGLSERMNDFMEVVHFIQGVDRLDKNGKRMPYTPLQLAKTMDPTMTASRLTNPLDLERMRTIAMGTAAMSDIVEDYYDAKEDIVDMRTRESIRQMFKDRKGKSGEDAELSYTNACIAVREALIAQASDYADIIAKQTPASQAAYQKPTTFSETMGSQMGGILKK